LYLAIEAFDSDSSKIRARVSRRDDIFNDDYVSIFLDTFNDRRKAYSFYFNPFGIQADGVFTEISTVNRFDTTERDLAWDGIIESKGRVNENGFAVEVSIPFKSLRFQKGSWGLHVERWIARKAERISWMMIPRSISGYLILMGTLNGLEGSQSGTTLDFIPSLVGSSDERIDGDSILENDMQADPGLTALWSVASNMTFSGALNPDFSQVESDVPQIEVNQRFPLFFEEKRPFFLEGTEIFRSTSRGSFTLVDTRRIVDPDFGAKLTGKIGRNTIAFLSSSDRAPGELLNQFDPQHGSNSYFNIFRYQRDILQDSNLGLFFTDVRFADSSNTLAALDGRIRLSETNDIGLQAMYSRSSQNDGTDISGAGYHFRFSHQGKPWRIIYYTNGLQDGYRASAGFTRRTGLYYHQINLGYEILPKTPTWFVSIRPFIVTKYQRVTGGLNDESFFDPGFDIVFAKNISLYFYHSWDIANFTGEDLFYDFWRGYLTINSFRKITFDSDFLLGDGVNFDPENAVVGDALQFQLAVVLKPNDKLNSEFRYLKSRLKDRTAGSALFDQNIYRNRTAYQFNKNHGIRSIIEYDSFSKEFFVSELYSFTPSPNTAVYVGYGDTLVDDFELQPGHPLDGFRRIQRTFFVKVSYNWRL
jgi:hypothetical protein